MRRLPEDLGKDSVTRNVSWDGYLRLLDELEDRRLRHAYDAGTLEITMPLLKDQQRTNCIMRRIVHIATFELDIPIRSVGSTTQCSQRNQAGIEPDECFYISHESEVQFGREYDPDRDRPP